MSEIIGDREQSSEFKNKLETAANDVLKETRTIGEAAKVYGLSYLKIHRRVQLKKFVNGDLEKEGRLEQAIRDVLIHRRGIVATLAKFGDSYTSILNQEVGYRHKARTGRVFHDREEILIVEILKTFNKSGICICQTCLNGQLKYLLHELVEEKHISTQITRSTYRFEAWRESFLDKHNDLLPELEEKCKDSYKEVVLTWKDAENILYYASKDYHNGMQCNCLTCSMERLPREIYNLVSKRSKKYPSEWDEEEKAKPEYVKYFKKRYDLILYKTNVAPICKKQELYQESTDTQETSSFDLEDTRNRQKDSRSQIKRSSDEKQLFDIDATSTKKIKSDWTSKPLTSKQGFINVDEKLTIKKCFPIFTYEEEKDIIERADAVNECPCVDCRYDRIREIAFEYVQRKKEILGSWDEKAELKWLDECKVRHKELISKLPCVCVCRKKQHTTDTQQSSTSNPKEILVLKEEMNQGQESKDIPKEK